MTLAPFHRIWPRRLQGRLLLTVALALLVVQAISAGLLYSAQAQRIETGMVHSAAIRLFAASQETSTSPDAPVAEIRSPAAGSQGLSAVLHSLRVTRATSVPTPDSAMTQ